MMEIKDTRNHSVDPSGSQLDSPDATAAVARAASVLSAMLKEHRSRQRQKLLMRGLKTKVATQRAHLSIEQQCDADGRSAISMFLHATSAPFTISLTPL